MASKELNALIALKRAKPYDPSQSVEALRGKGPDAGRIPRADTEVVACDADGVNCEWVTHGTTSSKSVFMFLHGGGYYRSSAAATRLLASNVSAAGGCRCFTVDYRLAPEHPFPAAIDDAFTAYQWMIKQGLTAKQIIVGGSSAGGGLAAALLMKLKAVGEEQPAAGVLLSPWTDLTQSAETYRTNADFDPAISKLYLDRMSAQYLGGADPRDALASPVFGDLRGLPPLLVQVGKSETMYGDALAYVEKARCAGVSVTFDPYDDVIHGWQNSLHVVADIPESLAAIERIGEFLKAQGD